ncbi:MAG: hypothetical protein AAF266_07910 [Planctomycetota bacterium]
MRIPLLAVFLLTAAIGKDTDAHPISARLDLVAIDQTTNPLVLDEAFDVYHLVVGETAADATLLSLEMTGLSLVEAEFGDREPFRSTPALDSIGEATIPYSFFVSGLPDETPPLVFDVEITGETLFATYGARAGTLFPSIGDGVEINGVTAAVLTVPAGAPKPDINGLLGAAYFADTIGIVNAADPLPGDTNGDRTVDLLDLDVFAPIFPQPPRREWPDLFDFNEDGVGDEKDVAILFANFGSTLFPDPDLIQFFVTDATETEIAIDPDFLALPPRPLTLLDLDILGANFGVTRATVSQGDYNGDQVVDLLDLDILGANFGSGPASVPEPGAAVLLLLVVACHGFAARTRWPAYRRSIDRRSHCSHGPTRKALRLARRRNGVVGRSPLCVAPTAHGGFADRSQPVRAVGLCGGARGVARLPRLLGRAIGAGNWVGVPCPRRAVRPASRDGDRPRRTARDRGDLRLRSHDVGPGRRNTLRAATRPV